MAYGLLYGMGKHALAKNMGVAPEQAQQLSDSFRASIPTLVSACTTSFHAKGRFGPRLHLAAEVIADIVRRAQSESNPRRRTSLIGGERITFLIQLASLLHKHSICMMTMRTEKGLHLALQSHVGESLLQCVPVQDKWLKETMEICRRHRFITTIGGRRRYLSDIVSADAKRRAAAERQAVNSVVQARSLFRGLDHF